MLSGKKGNEIDASHFCSVWSENREAMRGAMGYLGDEQKSPREWSTREGIIVSSSQLKKPYSESEKDEKK